MTSSARYISASFIAVLMNIHAGTVAADQGRIEVATLLNGDTTEKLHSFGSYSRVAPEEIWQFYAGLELIWIQLENQDSLSFDPRAAIGFMPGSDLAPFVEIGTNLADMLDLLSGSSRDCSQDQCDPDIDLKLGVRYSFHRNYTIGFYYQGIHFGDFHDHLTGEHDIYGMSLGIRL